MKKKFFGLTLTIASCLCVTCGLTACEEPHVHSYVEEITAPTCLEQGFTTYTCECGDTYVDDYVEALDHDYSGWVSNGDGTHTKTCQNDNTHTETDDCDGGNATCTNKAVCDDCNGEYGSILGHNYSGWVSNGDGTHTKTCQNDNTHTETVECSGGYATCTEKAICQGCHTAYGEELGHDWNDWVGNLNGTHTRTCKTNPNHSETKECNGGTATCTTYAMCKDCKEAYEEPLGHSWTYQSNNDGTHTMTCLNDASHVTTEECSGGTATCTEKPVCKYCKGSYDEELGHDYGSTQYSVLSGKCTAKQVCLNDRSHVVEETVEMVYEKEQDATCTNNEWGYNVAYFDNFEDYKQLYTKYNTMLEHVPGEYTFYADATCSAYGKLRAKCINCTAYLTKDDLSAPPTGNHVYGTNDRCTTCNLAKTVSAGLVYTRNSGESFATLTSFGSCTDTEVIIPQLPKNSSYIVKKIGANVFNASNYSSSTRQYIDAVTKVVIPASIETIGERAFYRMANLNTVIIEGDNVVIGKEAFYNCPNLTTVIIKGQNVEIGEKAFYECPLLSTVTIEKYVSKFGTSALGYCKSLKSIDLKSGLTEIGTTAFTGSGLESVVIPKTVTNMNRMAFSSCESLKSATFECNNISSIGEYVFTNCINLVSVKLPTNLTAIPDYAFNNCQSLVDITIPTGVTTIGQWAFSDCYSLYSIEIPSGVTSIGNLAFRYCYKLFEVINNSGLDIKANKGANSTTGVKHGYIGYYAYLVHNGESKIKDVNGYKFASFDRNYLLAYTGTDTELVLPENYNGDNYIIYGYAFYNRSDLTNITLGSGVIDVLEKATTGCAETIYTVKDGIIYLGTASNPYHLVFGITDTHLMNYTIDSNAKVVASNVFGACSVVSSISVPDGITYVGDYAFHATKITNCTVKDNVRYLGNDTNPYVVAYELESKNETSYTLDENTKIIYDGAFSGCKNCVSIYIPDGVRHIGDFAFSFNSKLADITLPSGLKYITGTMFKDCTSLVSINIPEGVKSIDNYAFEGCSKLENYILPEGLIFIGKYAFESTDIESLIIPDSVTIIDDNAFSYCGSLKYVVISKSVTSIGDSPFYYCGYFKTIYYEGTEEEWNKINISTFNNSYVTSAKKYFYSETQPETAGNYWHYENGVPTAW